MENLDGKTLMGKPGWESLDGKARTLEPAKWDAGMGTEKV
jgi:hypothetical protein